VRRTPLGFYVASVFAAVFCTCMVAAVLALDYGRGVTNPLWETILARAAAALLAVLSAVAAEALWRARPWAWRASRTLAVAYVTVVIVPCLMYGLYGLMVAFPVLLFSAVVLVPLLMYIRDRSAQLFGTPRIRRPTPIPSAPPVRVPVPAGRRAAPWW
jgi:hypothetical protein